MSLSRIGLIRGSRRFNVVFNKDVFVATNLRMGSGRSDGETGFLVEVEEKLSERAKIFIQSFDILKLLEDLR